MTEAYYILLYDLLRAYNRCTPSKVLRLRNDQVFVFGTDAKGSQRYGAADLAAKKFGAQNLTLLRQLRNDEAHQSQEASEQEVNAAIDIALDMYLYAVGTNITELEMGEATRVQA